MDQFHEIISCSSVKVFRRLYLYLYLQHAGQKGVLESGQPFIQIVARADQWMYIDKLLAQSTQSRGEWATTRPLHANLVDYNGGQVYCTFSRDGAFQDNRAPGSHQAQRHL